MENNEDKEPNLDQAIRGASFILISAATIYLGFGIVRLAGCNMQIMPSNASTYQQIPAKKIDISPVKTLPAPTISPAPIIPINTSPNPDTPDHIANDTLLSLLAILTVFGGVLAYVFQTTIKTELHREIRELARNERLASKAEADSIAAHVLWFNYYRNPQQKEFISEAIRLAKISIETIKELPDGQDYEYRDLKLKCKNNLAFYFAAKGQLEDRSQAHGFAKELYEQSASPNAKEVKSPYVHMATWALVLFRFFKDDPPSHREGCRLLGAILENEKIPLAERERLKARWSFIWQKETFDAVCQEIGYVSTNRP